MRRVRIAAGILAALLVAQAAEAEQKTIRGFVLAILSEGSFQLDEYIVLRMPGTRLEAPSGAEGVLRVGSELEVRGDYEARRHLLEATWIRLLPAKPRPLEGTAILEDPPEVHPAHVVVFCDGRRVRLDGRTELLFRGEKLRPIPLGEVRQELQPGRYIDYRGRLAADGVVDAERVVVWENTNEKAEAALLAAYEPRVHLLPDSEAPATLSVGSVSHRLYPDPVVQRYVERVGMRLVESLGRGSQPQAFGYPNFWFFVADNLRPGATAYPSGVVVVHAGLLYVVENEAQLAFLLAHEIAHTTQEHAWRQAGYHRRKLLVLRYATAFLTWVAEEAVRKGYERELEDQADRFALAYLVRAGYDPREGYRFLKRLERVWRAGFSPLLWGTHHGFSRRQAALMGLLRTSYRELAFDRLATNTQAYAAVRLHLPEGQIKTVAGQTRTEPPKR